MEKKFIVWLPGGINTKHSPEQEKWLEKNQDCDIKYTAQYRCSFLNSLESKRYNKHIARYMSE